MNGQQPDEEEWFNEKGRIYDRNRRTVAFVFDQDEDDSNARLIVAAKKMRAALQYGLTWNAPGWSAQNARILALDALAAVREPVVSPPVAPTRQTYEIQRSEELGWQAVALRFSVPSVGPRLLVIDQHDYVWVRSEGAPESLSSFRGLELRQIDGALNEIAAAEKLGADVGRQHPELGPFQLLDIAEYARERVRDARIQIQDTLGTWFSERLRIDAILREQDFAMSYDGSSVPPAGILKCLPDREVVPASEAISAEIRALSERWVELNDAMTSAHTDPLRIQELRLEALRNFVTTIWSDARLSESIRDSLNPVYQRTVQPALKRMEALDLPRAVAARVTDTDVYQLAVEADCSLLTARADLEAEAVAEITGMPVDYRADWRSDFEEAAERRALAQNLLAIAPGIDKTIVDASDPTAAFQSLASSGSYLSPPEAITARGATFGDSPSVHNNISDVHPSPLDATSSEFSSAAAWTEAGASESDLIAIEQAGGYRAILANRQAQLDLQGILDRLIGSRITDVRIGLRSLDWDGPLHGMLTKEMGPVLVAFDHSVQQVGAAGNLLSVTFIAKHADTGESIVERLDEMKISALDMALDLEEEIVAKLQAQRIKVQPEEPREGDQLEGP